MTLKASNLVAVATGTTELQLKAEANESFLIKRVDYFAPTITAENFSVSVDRRKVNQFVAPAGFNIATQVRPSGLGSLVTALASLGLLRPIPVATGQTLACTAAGSGNAVQVVYDVYDAGDIKADDFNGSESTDYQLFQVVSNSATPTPPGDVELNVSDLDSQFPAFPGGDTVPSGKRVELVGLFGAGYSRGDGTDNNVYSSRLKLIQDRKDILDQSLNGMLYQGDSDNTTNGVKYATDLGLLDIAQDLSGPGVYLFDEPINFNGGTELNVFTTLVAGTTPVAITAGDVKLGLILNYYGT